MSNLLPNYDPSNVDLTPDEHEGVEPLYSAIQKGHETLADGAQVNDLIQIPVIAADAGKTINWILQGEAGPNDDDLVADRMFATGMAMIRASQLMKKVKI